MKNLRIEDARKKIDELNATIQDKIDNKKKKDIVASIQKKKVKVPKMPCFRPLSDAKKFVEKLIAKAPIQPFQLQNSHVDEIYAITWLMLLTPLTLKQIIDAKWGSIADGANIDNDMPFPRWIFNMSGGHRNSLKQSLLIGPMRHNLPINRHQTANDYIFPNIAKDVKQAQKDIQLKMKEIFDDYPINPEHFTSFFRHVAIRYSCYKSEFIDAYIKMQHGDKYWASMRTELDNLSRWWHWLVTVNKFSYAEENPPLTIKVMSSLTNTPHHQCQNLLICHFPAIAKMHFYIK